MSTFWSFKKKLTVEERLDIIEAALDSIIDSYNGHGFSSFGIESVEWRQFELFKRKGWVDKDTNFDDFMLLRGVE